jgi:hypothetical protein
MAMAVPITSAISVAIIYDLSDTKSIVQQYATHSGFSQDIKSNVQPFREELLASFRQIEPTDAPKLDTQAL